MNAPAGTVNHERLNDCAGPHDFRRQSNARYGMPPVHVCTRCGGTASTANVGFYLADVRAGKQLAECERAGGSGASEAPHMAAGSLP